MENYRDVIYLAPAGGEREADGNKREADDHIPGADIRNWIEGLGDIEGNDPGETEQEGADHDWGEPTWAL